jgi:glycosyltransferase involved in cell wall biosynthesis
MNGRNICKTIVLGVEVILKILTFNGVYLPGYKAGGPIRSLANLASHLKDDIELYILTRDRDAGDTEPYENIEFNKWVKLTNEHVFYQKEKEMSIFTLRRIINCNDYHGVLLNGILSEYTIRYLLLRRLKLIKSKPTIIMPHGDLSRGALSLKNKKKSIYLKIAKILGLYDGLVWLATSDSEKNDTLKVFGRKDIVTIPNLPYHSSQNGNDFINIKEKGNLDVIYISRITKVKNLLFALKVLNDVKGYVNFNIYGPISDNDYWNSCQKFISSMNRNIKVKYHGSLPHEKVKLVFKRSDVLLLPTLGENYGHVIVEALSVGVPVIISDQTPWRNLSLRNAGWDIPLENENGYANAIQTLVDMDKEEFLKFKFGAKKYLKEVQKVSETKEAYTKLFKETYTS